MQQPVWPSWINGEPGTALPLTDRGLQFGDGLFETLRVSDGRIPLLPFHRARLQEGVARLCIPVAIDALFDQLQRFIAALPEASATLKLIITRGNSSRGYAMAADEPPTVVMQSFPFVARPDEWYQQGAALAQCETRLGINPTLAGLKHLNRLEQVLARREFSSQEAIDGLLLDIEGRVIEGCMSNIFWRTAQQWYTPELHRCGVDGVLRRWLLQGPLQAAEIGDYALSALEHTDEVFVCNSQMGIVPIASLQHHRWPVGPQTQRLMQAWEALNAA